MPEPIAPPPSQQSGELKYMHHYDRDLEAQTELKLMNMVKAFQEWCIRKAYFVNNKKYVMAITDSEAIGEIREIYATVGMLCDKYNEPEAVKVIDAYLKWLSEQHELNGPATLNDLHTLAKIMANNLGRKHRFMDNLDK